MTEHTSGKWKVFDAYDVMGKPGLVAASRIGAVTDDGIETVVKASCYGYDEINMTKADAYLIAAAPDLLAACEEALAEIIESISWDEVEQCCTCSTCSTALMLRAAIAKAKGERQCH